MSFEISTQSLLWRPQDTDAKQVTFSNTLNNIDPAVLRLTIGAPVSNSNSDFFWAVPGPQLLGRGRSFSLTVKPPMWASGAAPQVKVGSVPWNVVDAANGAPLQDGNIELRNDAVSSVLQGELAITQLVSNPPGQDLSPEGEFFELRNLTARPLNLDRCQVMQRTFSLQGNPSDVIAAKFGGPPAGADFGKNWTLPPGATLRVLTRGKANSDPFDDPLRFYLNKGNPIWNNAGDRITVLNADGDLLARFSYGNQANQAGFPDVNGPSGPAQGAPLTLFSDFTVSLNATFGLVPVFTLEPDDVVIFSTTEATLISVFLTTGAIGNGTVGNSPGSPERLPSGSSLLILPRRIGVPELAPEDDPWPWPVSGAPKYSLVGAFDEGGANGFAIGAGVTRTFPLDRPRVLFLGMNDNVVWDNRGMFVVRLRVFRS